MKKKLLVTMYIILILIGLTVGIIAIVNNSKFNNYSAGSSTGIFNTFEKINNNQIIVSLSPNEINSYEQPTYFRYSLTNNNEVLDTIYTFHDEYTDVNVEEYINSGNYEQLENMYSNKYCYSYDNGDEKSNVFIKEFAHFPEPDKREYDGWYRYIRDLNYNKIIEDEWIDLEDNDRHEVTVYHHIKNYDENGNISFVQNLGYKDEVDAETQFVYDEDGNIEHEYWSNTFGDYYDYNFTYEYSEGNPKRVNIYKNNVIDEIYDYEYDINNNIIKIIRYIFDSNGEKHHKQTNEYQYNSDNNIIQENREYYDSLSEKYEYSQFNYYYNENQNLKKIAEQTIYGGTKYSYFIYTDTPSAYFADNQ